MNDEVVKEEDIAIVTANTDNVRTNDINVRARGQRRRVTTVIADKSMTKQADLKRACIHNILNKYEKTGLLPQRKAQPIEGPVPDVNSYHQAMTILVEAQTAFNELPSDIREKFNNNPAEFLEFVNDEENQEEMKEMGLTNPEEVAETMKVEVVGGDTQTEEDATSAPQNAGEGASS